MAPLLLGLAALTGCASGDEGTADRRFALDPTAADDVTKSEDGADVTTPDAPAAPAATPAPAKQNTCQTARDIGTLNADALSTQPISAQGTCSEWVKFTALESVKWDGARMMIKATLVSPKDAPYELHVYLNKDADQIECSTEVKSTTTPSGPEDVVTADWGDPWGFPNASDDKRTVSVEIRAKNPASCGKGNWVLFVDRD